MQIKSHVLSMLQFLSHGLSLSFKYRHGFVVAREFFFYITKDNAIDEPYAH